MVCPKCGGKVRVAYCLPNETSVLRKRNCNNCGYTFCTTESIQKTSRFEYDELMRVRSLNEYTKKRVRKEDE